MIYIPLSLSVEGYKSITIPSLAVWLGRLQSEETLVLRTRDWLQAPKELCTPIANTNANIFWLACICRTCERLWLPKMGQWRSHLSDEASTLDFGIANGKDWSEGLEMGTETVDTEGEGLRWTVHRPGCLWLKVKKRTVPIYFLPTLLIIYQYGIFSNPLILLHISEVMPA